MLVAYELKITLEEVLALDKEEIGWWLAFFKRRNEMEEAASKKRGRRSKSR